ncbi:MAG: DUF6294 family protein [Chloroflexota bacterium]
MESRTCQTEDAIMIEAELVSTNANQATLGQSLSDDIDDSYEIEAQRAITRKVFRWPHLVAGDCTLTNGVLTVISNGTAHWQANVLSSDPGEDSWGCRFEFLTIHGVSIWLHGWIWSPTLHGAPTNWVSSNQIFFPPHIFPSLGRVSMSFRC